MKRKTDAYRPLSGYVHMVFANGGQPDARRDFDLFALLNDMQEVF